MCLAIPAKIVAFKSDTVAWVEMGAVTKDVQVNLIEEPRIGDYVIIHAGFALSRLDEDEALKTLELMREVGLL